MSTDIRLKHSKVASRVPTSGDLKDGELGLNLADEKIYMKNADGDVVQVAGPGNDYGEYVKLAGDATAQTITGTGGLDVDGLVESGGGVKVTGGDPNLVQSGLIKVGSGGVKLINSAANVNLTLNQADTGGEQAVGAEFTVKDNCIGRGDGGTMYGFRVNHPGTLSTTVSTGQYIGFTSSVNLTSAVDKVYGFYGATDGSTGATGISAAFYAANNTIDGISHNFFAAGASPNYFAGDVAIGESTTFFGNLGDAIALLPPTITEEFANIISSLPTAQPFTGDPTTLPADIPTPLKDALVRVTTAGKINLNSDGSAEFAGNITATGAISATSTGTAYEVGSVTLNEDGYVYAKRAAGDGVNVFVGANENGDTSTIDSNGNAEFAGNIDSGDYAGNAGVQLNSLGAVFCNRSNTSNGLWYGQLNGNTTSSILANGSAEFAGDVKLGQNFASPAELFQNNDTSKYGLFLESDGCLVGSRVDDSCLILNQKGNVPAGPLARFQGNGSDVIVFNKTGDATFTGDIQRGGNPYQGGEEGVSLVGPGKVMVCRENGTTFESYDKGSQTATISMSTDGSATFGEFNATSGSARGVKLGIENDYATVFVQGKTGTDSNKAIEVWLANAERWSVTFNGTSTFSNTILNLEPDNDANYTTTTEEYEETIQVPVVGGIATADLVNGAPEQQFTEQTVTRTREVTTYTGPTLDVKESVLDLQQRLDTRDAQLEQALARIQELESADSSALEARIAALEVDMNRFKAI